jgi:hypothetical protein
MLARMLAQTPLEAIVLWRGLLQNPGHGKL